MLMYLISDIIDCIANTCFLTIWLRLAGSLIVCLSRNGMFSANTAAWQNQQINIGSQIFLILDYVC